MSIESKSATVLVLTLIVSGACQIAQPSADAFIVRDSAGVAITISHSPKYAGANSWRLSSDADLIVGTSLDQAELQLFRVSRAHALDNGAILIAQNGPPASVLLLDSAGNVLKAIGSIGDGPGEYRSVTNAWFVPPDSIVVFDPQKSQVTTFSANGDVLGTKTLRQPPNTGTALPIYVLLGRFDDGTFLLRPNAPLMGEAGATGVSQLPAVRAMADGRSIDTIGIFPDAEFTRASDGEILGVHFGKRAAFLAAGRSYIQGFPQDFSVEEYDLSGRLIRRMRRKWTPRGVTPRMVDLLRQQTLQGLDENTRRAFAERFDRWPVAAQLPAFGRGVLVDSERNIWIEHYRAPTDSTRIWTVFGPNGEWLTDLDVPASYRITSVHTDRVLGIWQDSLDVETVRQHRLLRN